MKTKTSLIRFGITGILIVFNSFCSFVNGQSVTIYNQVWTTVNLDVSTFRNGDPIPEAKTDSAWARAGRKHKPAWCYCKGDDAKNKQKYGKLYNWYAVHDSRGLAPAGWHVPAYNDWSMLISFLGGNDDAARKMKSASGWGSNGNGNDSVSFSALPAGYRSYNGILFAPGFCGYFWSSTEFPDRSAGAQLCAVCCNSPAILRYDNNQGCGYSVRCVKDKDGN
jgi:uncharacterized protein (TIGR02145 family)